MSSVLTDIKDGVATITLNEPERRNPMSVEIMAGFASAIADVRANDEVRAVVVTGAPPAFCAGADLKNPGPAADAGPDRLAARERLRAFYAQFQCLFDAEVPTIAAVNGAAVGGGLGLALCADIRIFADDAKIAANFAKIGIHPGMATTYLLPSIVGRPAAAEIFFTGKFFDGREAERLGLGTSLPKDEVLPAAQAMAAEIASNQPGIIRMIKKALRVNGSREQALEYEMSAQLLASGLRRTPGH
jgi:enoyl-CoA hydratase